MPLNIKPSSGSGSITLQATTGTTTNDTLTLPASTGTVALTASPTFTGTTTTGAQSVGGNITFSAADAGIIFNKTGALTNSTLNDYEVGTWTPSLVFAGNAVGMTYSSRAASYTKVGRLVNIRFALTLSAKGSSTGSVSIQGYPFTPSDTYAGIGVVAIDGNGASLPVSIYGLVWTDGNIYIRYGNTTAWSAIADTNITNTTNMYGSFTYYV